MLLRADVVTKKVVRGTKQGIGDGRIDGVARLLCDNLASNREFKCSGHVDHAKKISRQCNNKPKLLARIFVPLGKV